MVIITSQGLEKGDEIKPNNAMKQNRTRAIERRAERMRKTRQIESEDYRLSQVWNSRVEILCSRARKVTWSSDHKRIRNQTCLCGWRNYKTVNTAGKMRLIPWSVIKIFATSFCLTEDLHQSRVNLPTWGKCRRFLCRLLWKLWRCLSFLNSKPRCESHFMNYIAIISLIS